MENVRKAIEALEKNYNKRIRTENPYELSKEIIDDMAEVVLEMVLLSSELQSKLKDKIDAKRVR